VQLRQFDLHAFAVNAYIKERNQERPAMERFIHRENLEHYRKLLTQSTDEGRREQILKLLAEEEAKDQRQPKKEGAAK
jgi:hypothetical protein